MSFCRKYFLPLFILLLFADQITKKLAILFLKQQDSLRIIGQYFQLTYVENTGAAFGSLQGQKTLLIIITIPAFMLVLYILKKSTCELERCASLLILSGAAGNFIDRIFRGFVIDFLDADIPDININNIPLLPEINLSRWPVFNLADIFINAGAFIIVILLFKKNNTPVDNS